MIERVLRLADKPVRALMTPRNDLAWLDRSDPPADIAARLRASDVTRFIVADGRVDNVVGVVVAKDLLDQMLEGAPMSLGRVLRQPLVLPDTLTALDALERLRGDRLGLALVMDEYGRVKEWPKNFFGDATGEIAREMRFLLEGGEREGNRTKGWAQERLS